MFGTQTKETGYSARGLSMLHAVRQAVALPIVAIGGITEGNVAQVWQNGADSAAIIGDLLHASNIVAKAGKILSLYQGN
jgi:thiamine monophosphate synthase